jgi:hypothetical protein
MLTAFIRELNGGFIEREIVSQMNLASSMKEEAACSSETLVSTAVSTVCPGSNFTISGSYKFLATFNEQFAETF